MTLNNPTLDVNTLVMTHKSILQTFETPGIATIVAGTTTVGLGSHIFIANAVAGTLAMGGNATIPAVRL